MMINKVDNHKLMWHPDRVSEWLEKGDCFPIYIEIGPTNRCNHRCTYCALDWFEYGGTDIESDVVLRALKNMAQSGVKSIMFAGEGEPLLHTHIEDFIVEAKNCGLDVAITTNGVLFDEKKAETLLPNLTWIRFSVDAGTPETYSSVHKTKPQDFDRLIENITNAVHIKKELSIDVDICVQALLIPETAKEIKKLAALVKETGADHLQVKPYSRHPFSKNSFTINYDDYDNLEIELKAFESEKFKVFFRKNTINRLRESVDYNCCYGLPFFALTDAKGNIMPCNLFYNNNDFSYGNLYETAFSDIWNGKKRKEVIKRLNEKGISECRKNCRLDAINGYLYKLKNLTPGDNFI